MKLARLITRPNAEPIRVLGNVEIFPYDPNAEIEFLHYGQHPLSPEHGTVNNPPRGTFIADWTPYLKNTNTPLRWAMEIPNTDPTP